MDAATATRYCRPDDPSGQYPLRLKIHACSSSLRQSMKADEAAPTGDWQEESTVFADVESMELEGASVRVYDCAGQVTTLFCDSLF